MPPPEEVHKVKQWRGVGVTHSTPPGMRRPDRLQTAGDGTGRGLHVGPVKKRPHSAGNGVVAFSAASGAGEVPEEQTR